MHCGAPALLACSRAHVQGMRTLLPRRSVSSSIVAFLFFPTAAERVYHAGQLKYHGGAGAKRSAGPGLSADELRDTY